MEVRTAEHLLDAPPAVIALAYEAISSIQAERAFGIEPIHGEEMVNWIEVEGAPAAVQLLERQRRGRLWFIKYGYVTPAHRGKGLTDLFRAFNLERARADPLCHGIEYRVKVDNEAMNKNALRAGVKPDSYIYRTDIDRLLNRGS